MIHALLVLAVIAFIIWLLFHAVGALVHLLWLVIVAALLIWALRYVFGRGRSY